jgi:outer membrane protein TolC
MGVTTMLELLTSQANVVEAQTNLAAARFDYRLAYATLLALAGRQP